MMDDELLALVREFAAMQTSCELPSAPLDFELDSMIWTARAIIRRESKANDNAIVEVLARPSAGSVWL